MTAICQAAHYHLRKIGRIRKYITFPACEKLIHTFVTSCIDYGNALLYGLPKIQLNRLQRILNIAARIPTCSYRFDSISTILCELHWLKIEQRIDYKVLLLTFKCLNGLAHSYLSELLTLYQPTRNLRSSSANLLVVPHVKTTTFGQRSFSYAAPYLWNKLPNHMKEVTTISAFKTCIKTHLFTKLYWTILLTITVILNLYYIKCIAYLTMFYLKLYSVIEYT